MNSEYHIINEDARIALRRFRGQAYLIVTSPPYADARKRHYDSIDPNDYAAWFASFHEPLATALKPNGSLVINIKDKIVDGVRYRYVWDTIKVLEGLGWYAIDESLAQAKRDAGLLADAAARCLGVLFSPLAQQAAVCRFRCREAADRGLGRFAPGAARAQRHHSAEFLERQRLRPQHLAMG
jgi:hypothetical protein